LDIKEDKLVQLVDASIELVKRLISELAGHGQDLHWLFNTKRRTGSDPSRRILSLSQGER